MTERQIAQRVVAVTGGGRGIGLATTRALVARGARVAVGDLDGDLAAQAGGALGAALDVSRRDSFAAFLQRVESEIGPIDVLINNAGVMHVGPFLDEDDAWSRRQFDVNVHGVILGCKLALPAMLGRRSGHIVNVASAAAKVGVPREAVYAATKHAVLGLSESLRAELRGTGVDLSVVMPGLVRTELAAGTLQGSKVLTPDDVAQAIAGVIERPRFDVYVPRAYRGLPVVAALLPRPAREAFLRAVGVGRNTAGTTAERRAGYEARALSRSDPPRSKH